MDERLEGTRDIVTVHERDGAPRHGHQVVRDLVIGRFVENVGVADDAESVPALHTLRGDGAKTSVDLVDKGLSVVEEVFVVLLENARREPQFTHMYPFNQLGEALAMVLVRVRQREGGEVRITVSSREILDQVVDDRDARVVIVLCQLKVANVDEHNVFVVDRDHCGVAGSDVPERESRLRQLEVIAAHTRTPLVSPAST